MRTLLSMTNGTLYISVFILQNVYNELMSSKIFKKANQCPQKSIKHHCSPKSKVGNNMDFF